MVEDTIGGIIMSIIRTAKRENPFVQLDKFFLSDENLTFEAKGILAYVLSKPDTWTIRKQDMIKRSKSGKTRIESAMLELMANGYLNWYRLRENDGTFGEWVYDVYERPEFNPEAEKFIEEGRKRIAERKDKNKSRNAKKLEINVLPDVELPSDMEKKSPKADNRSLVSPKVDNPPLDNPPLDNQPYSNKELRDIELRDIELKKNDEEEYIYRLRNENVVYDFIFNYLTEKGLSEETANEVILSCDKNKLDVVTKKDVEKQYEHMIAKINNEEAIYDFSSYFVGGLMKKAELTIINMLNEREVAVLASTEEVRSPVPFYNWLEERG